MTETHALDLDGFTYGVTQLPAMRATKLLARLGRLAGPALLQLVGDLRSGGLADADLSGLGETARQFFAGLTDAELESVIRELLGTVTVTTLEGKTAPVMPVFDTHFQGRLDALFRLLWFALEANYGNFFVALAGAAKGLMAGAGRSPASTTSPTPGPAGG